jgi:hypothetical protein
MLFVSFIIAFIKIAIITASPFALPMLEAVLKVTSKSAAIFPFVLPVAVWLAVHVLTNILIAIAKKVCAAAVS